MAVGTVSTWWIHPAMGVLDASISVMHWAWRSVINPQVNNAAGMKPISIAANDLKA